MRSTPRAIAVLLTAIVVLVGAFAAPVAAAVGPTSNAKVVIIVGPTESQTAGYRTDADAIYAEAIKYTPNVTRIYSPNATWAAVKPAIQGANIVVYLGHGNGWPSPYTYDPNFTTKDGFGLNDPANLSDSRHIYYGEPYIRNEITLAPNALVILNHACYSSGSSESGDPEPTLDVARQRVDNFGSAFLTVGARAVIASYHRVATEYIRAMFTKHMTVVDAWRSLSDYNGNELSFASGRVPGVTAILDPETPGGGGYNRSYVGTLDVRTDDVLGGPPPPPAEPSPPSTYVALPPTRLLDSRTGNGLSGAFVAGVPRAWPIAGRGGVPAGAVAVTGNLTVAGASRSGYVSLTPTPTASPSTSTINFPGGDIRANGVTVTLAPDGSLAAVYMAQPGSVTDLVFDVTGYYVADTSGTTYVALPPTRLLDSRTGNGLSGAFVAGVPRAWPIAGRGGVPAGAVAVTGNLTVAGASRSGYVSLTPTPTASPSTSTINFPGGDIRANGVTVTLAPDGSLAAVYMAQPGSVTDLVFDVTGYYVADTSGTTYVALPPTRLLDSRTGNGLSGAFVAGVPRAWPIAGRGGVPAGAVAVTGNLTVAGASRSGYVSLTPTPTASPSTSTINFPGGDIRANGVTVTLAPDGSLAAVYMAQPGSVTDLVFDVTGYYVAG